MAQISIDIDDTLFSFERLARHTLVQEAIKTGNKALETAAYAPWTEWRAPVDILGAEEWHRVISLCHSDEAIMAQTPHPGAVETLRLLRPQHNLMYVTSRSKTCYDTTMDWLINNDFPPGLLFCSEPDKAKYLKDCQYLIDDRPSTLVRFVYDREWGIDQPPRLAFGLHTPYNGALTDVPGIYLAPDWSMLQALMEKKGIYKWN